MSTSKVRELLQQLQRGISQPSVAVECQCSNLETVYVSVTLAGEVLVSDHGKTFAYLRQGIDSTYRPTEELDMIAITAACRQLGAVLKTKGPEAYPTIECVAAPEEAVADVVERVAEAVDRVFEMALRSDL